MSVLAALGLLLVATGPLLASWLLVRARRGATRRMWLNVAREHSSQPLTAFKTAQVLLSPDGTAALFTGVTLGRPYRTEDVARCPRAECASPGLDCECGFYAYRDRDDAVELLGRRLLFNGLRSKALLSVELSGEILEYERGYRAQRQTVLRVEFSARCAVCAERRLVTAATTLGTGGRHDLFPVAADLPKGHAAVPDHRPLRPLCAEHARDRTTVAPADLAGLLGTEVLWLSPANEPSPWRPEAAGWPGGPRWLAGPGGSPPRRTPAPERGHPRGRAGGRDHHAL